jgi:hypothetical protein
LLFTFFIIGRLYSNLLVYSCSNNRKRTACVQEYWRNNIRKELDSLLTQLKCTNSNEYLKYMEGIQRGEQNSQANYGGSVIADVEAKLLQLNQSIENYHVR